MIKYIILVIIVIVSAATAFHLYRVSVKNKKEMTKYEGSRVEITKNLGKVLVIYYSKSGKTKDIAEIIKDKTNADIYAIQTVEPIPDGPKLYLTSKKEISSGKYPALKNDIPDVQKYDIIFIGAPVWWYTMATPLFALLQEVDFQGKKVVPFSTQGSNYGTFFEDFKSKIKNAVVLRGEQFNNLSEKYNNSVDNKISLWLNNLDI